MKAYSKDGPFMDPVVRCDSCHKILLVSKLKEDGACTCGVRKVRNLFSFTPEEKQKMERWGVDPDFLVLFEGVQDE